MSALVAFIVGALLVPAVVSADPPGPGYQPHGVKWGTAKVTGKTLIVKTERTKPLIQPPRNDAYLRIADIPAGATVTPPYGGQTFAAAFPNGAYEVADLGWGEGSFLRELYAGTHCLQVANVDGDGYDAARVYCDKTGVTRIKISSGNGNDVVVVDPVITVTITHPCGGKRSRCGTLSCLEATPYTCCDGVPGLDGCVDRSGGTCAFDPGAPQIPVWCPPF
jgi:hypothetical protein